MRNGYFVEFGATDGVTNSNTALLKREYGWHGILAEPNPAWHRRLRQSRHAHIDPRCLAARTGEQVEFVLVEDPELSTIATYAGGDHFAEVRRRGESISVETVALNDLLAAHGAPGTIDYMSIDTEGSEWEILSTFDFSRWQVRLLSIEHNNTEREHQMGSDGAASVPPGVPRVLSVGCLVPGGRPTPQLATRSTKSPGRAKSTRGSAVSAVSRR